jgi:hypothetical protein
VIFIGIVRVSGGRSHRENRPLMAFPLMAEAVFGVNAGQGNELLDITAHGGGSFG